MLFPSVRLLIVRPQHTPRLGTGLSNPPGIPGGKHLLEPNPRAVARPVTKAGDTVDPSRGNNFYATACSEGSHEVGSPKPMQLSIFRLSGDTSQFCLGGMLVT